MDEKDLPLLGNQGLIQELRQRLEQSKGGTFLITGFRGVGKSTIIMQALGVISSTTTGEIVVPIIINVARPIAAEHLLFAIVRRLYEALADENVIARLDETTQRALMLAYIRTSIGIKQTRSDASERGTSLQLGVGTAIKKLSGPAGWLVPSVGFSTKRTKSLAMEASYLTYAESDVEHDLARIIKLLSRPAPARRWWRRKVAKVHLVIVLDEVDKLTSSPDGLNEVQHLLSSIKNTLTMRGAHFLVAAGPDLHDHAVRDSSRGNGVYESVFAWRRYVPCIWHAPDMLVKHVLKDGDSPAAHELASYLRFKARGVPRRLLQEFGDLIRWERGRPFLVIDDADKVRVAFYARLEELLGAYFSRGHRERLFREEIDEDRWRLMGYYVVDWILRRQGDSFTVLDIEGSAEEPELDPLLRIARRSVNRLLRHLTDHEILVVVRDPERADATMVGQEAEGGVVSYKLADEVAAQLLGIAWGNESERAALAVSLRVPLGLDTSTTAGSAGQSMDGTVLESVLRTIADRYELVELIGEGGMSRVYRARDKRLRREVAVKMPHSGDRLNPELASRYDREATIAVVLRHPRIVRTLEVISGDDGLPILIMDLIDGITLQELVDTQGPLPSEDVTLMALQVAEALEYLRLQGVFRLDLKPSNIMMTPSSGAVIIDFGIAKRSDMTVVTDANLLIGTPAYMSPESISSMPVDIRGDIYSLGVVMCFALTGRIPYENADNLPAVVANIISGNLIMEGFDATPQLREVIRKIVALHPEDRFRVPADIIDALRLTPEGQTFTSDDSSTPSEQGWEVTDTRPVDIRSMMRPDYWGEAPTEILSGYACIHGHISPLVVTHCTVCNVSLANAVVLPVERLMRGGGISSVDD
ncbi:protein kinase domain-containing protein [Herbidospora daliensis]|uniref:protein kinase domain-containing protein n=1 Tax=Herbidospora daliensis TaxID=295585 RepID=UPI0018DC637B|nr:protein kinase [Herbidospora daliensis]